ncbi:MAG: LytR C-terminal domain-containing protein [Pseudomonadota bacterium]
MIAQRTLRYCIASAFLLQACATAPVPKDLVVHPALQVRHSTNETAEAYYQLGRTHQLQGNLDMALTGYTYAIARDPRHMEARNAAAAIHAQQGRLDQARAMMLAVIADYPSVSQAYNNLGYIDYLRGEHAGAAQEIRQALALDPHNERARNNLRLVETALAARPVAAPPETAPAVAPQAPALIAVAAQPAVQRAPQLELVQVVPNVYQLKMSAPVAVPLMAAAPLLPVPVPGGVPALAPSRIAVANGDGTPGLARRVGAMLGQHGYPVARLSNERPFGQRNTRIFYRPGYVDQAEALRKLIDGRVLLAPASSLGANADLRVVLGRDTQRVMALREAASVKLATR